MGEQGWTYTERAAEDHAKLSNGQVKRLKTVMANVAKSNATANSGKTAPRAKRAPRANKVSAS